MNIEENNNHTNEPSTMQEVTVTHIAKWKKEHGDLQQIEVDGYAAILKEPSRKDLAYAGAVGQKDPMKFNEIILNKCWVFGDKEIFQKTGLFISACNKMNEIIGIKEVKLKKL